MVLQVTWCTHWAIRHNASLITLASRGPAGSCAVVYALLRKYPKAALFFLEMKIFLVHWGVVKQVLCVSYFSEDRWLDRASIGVARTGKGVLGDAVQLLCVCHAITKNLLKHMMVSAHQEACTGVS